ncbi:MAG TPA: DUF4163 domain-containing protein, partial [Phototrophicaceae bacterium]|nr:DUF4163 domain-containing protein [Phototrophicaceae bacterium]
MKRIIVGVLCLLCFSMGTVHATGVDDCVQKGGTFDTDGKCILSAWLDVSIDYPLELAQNTLVANTIDPFLQSYKDEFVSYLMGGFQASSAAYSLDISYETYRHSDDMFTLVFSIYEYTGGAHGNDHFQTYSFDLASNRVMTLDDLFAPGNDPWTVIAPLVEADLANKVGDLSDPDWIHEG